MTILDRVALWVGRIVLDGVAIALLMSALVLLLGVRDALRQASHARRARKETCELERMAGVRK